MARAPRLGGTSSIGTRPGMRHRSHRRVRGLFVPITAALAAALLATSVPVASAASLTSHISPSEPPFLEAVSLPVCPKPGPQDPNLTPAELLPITDPAATHCTVIPSNAGLNLKGIDNNKFLVLSPSVESTIVADNFVPRQAAVAKLVPARIHGILVPHTAVARSATTPNVTSNSQCLPDGTATISCQNGVAQSDTMGYTNWTGVAASLDAQTAYLYGYDDIYNWIGEQNSTYGGQLT